MKTAAFQVKIWKVQQAKFNFQPELKICMTSTPHINTETNNLMIWEFETDKTRGKI